MFAIPILILIPTGLIFYSLLKPVEKWPEEKAEAIRQEPLQIPKALGQPQNDK